MAYWGPHQHGESSKSSGGGGGPIQQPDYGQQCPYVKNVAYLGHEELLPYQSPYYSEGFGGGEAYGLQTGDREVDDEECYGRPIQQHTYASVVTQPALPPQLLRQEYAPYMQPVNEALLQRLEQAGQPVPATAAFLQDSLAIVVIEGLLNQIEMMKRQHVTMLEHIEHAGKHKAPAYKELMVEPKRARAPVRQPQEFVQAPAPTAVQPPPPPVQPPSSSVTLISVHLDSVLPHQEPDNLAIVENPLAELSLEPHDEIMTDAPAMQQEQRVEAPHVPVMSSQAGLSSQGEVCLAPEIPELKAQPAAVESHRLSTSSYAPDVPGPTKHHSRTLKQYDGLVVIQQKTAAASKGKGKAVATVNNESNYWQFSSEDEQESEEG
ncbi:hypothetical protein C0995_008963, partial [Termitomyces sp. Mi166